jgi:hypothetical protein
MDRPKTSLFRRSLVALAWSALLPSTLLWADESVPLVNEVAPQPLVAQARRLVEAMEFLGEPLSKETVAALDKAAAAGSDEEIVRGVQQVLDQHVLAVVEINPESRVKSQPGPAPKELAQNGWRNFVVKVLNSAGVTAELKLDSPNAKVMVRPTNNSPDPPVTISADQLRDRFLDVATFNSRPLSPTLSGLKVEYRIVQLYCRDSGDREATLQFHVGQGTQDIGFRSETAILFHAKPACQVVLHVADDDGAPTTGWFVFRDKFGRVYPSQTRRLAPDFFFHPQVYRGDGENVMLPPGDYTVTYSRGPEYVVQSRPVHVPESAASSESFKLQRWIHLRKLGWYSGDHHIHAAGCAHYDNPTKGVMPADMFRHCVGEDLNVGCCLSWGPCWYYQKGFFEGKTHDLSLPNYLLRYDVEVSGFPSSHAGHLCLIRLKEDDFPGTKNIEQWPSWDLPILQWGKKQGGVVGFSHSGAGLACQSTELPNLEMPKFDGIGANEYIVDVVHDACDFISAADTPIVWELNIWYHTLNCGYKAKISGETDFPCVYGERVGLGRGYVKLDGPLTFDRWADAIAAGRSYVCDGLSHLVDFAVDGVGVGEKEISLDAPRTVRVTTRMAGHLKEDPNDPDAVRIRSRQLLEQPFWHVERARIAGTRKVPVELIVNGKVAARQEIEADGTLRDVAFDLPIERSCWVALRIFASSHTNPIFINVGGAPIRGSKASAEWCRKAVDVCWESKKNAIRADEREAAQAAYDVARKAYDQIILESPSP